MSALYAIPLAGMKEGRHFFDFKLDREFFEEFEGSEITEGELRADVEMTKRSGHVDLMVTISGTVNICCDRCLDYFPEPISSTNRIIVRYGREAVDEDPDMITVPFDEPELDLKQHFYEFIYLALPIRRVHPDDADGNSTCDPEMLKQLGEHLIDEEKEADPRWDELKKFMNDN